MKSLHVIFDLLFIDEINNEIFFLSEICFEFHILIKE